MGGGPSHLDTWDPKPALTKLQGKDVPDSIAKNVPMNKRLRLQNLYPSPYEFKPYGRSGIPVSTLFKETAAHVDDICVIRSMKHDSPIHTPAEYLALTGSLTGARPTIGAWLHYGLGSENQNLPGFVVMDAGENFSGPAIWWAGFLPTRYQGTLVKASEGIANIRMPAGFTEAARRTQLDFMERMNRRHLERHGGGSELEARILSYELAFRMQMAAPEVFDLKGESEQTLVIWGGEFGRTPAAEGSGRNPGRDHSPTGYCMWLAGGGVKGGQVIGATDDVGYTVVDRPIHPNDFHATILHALGVDQQELYYEHQNRKELATFNGGEVIEEVFG